MASVNKGKNSSVSLLIVLIFLLQLLSPIISPDVIDESDLSYLEPSLTHPYVDVDQTDYGHDFAGSDISIDELIDAKVRAESALDLCNSHVILNAFNQTPGTPDI